jgi:hypothetical protein
MSQCHALLTGIFFFGVQELGLRPDTPPYLRKKSRLEALIHLRWVLKVDIV